MMKRRSRAMGIHAFIILFFALPGVPALLEAETRASSDTPSQRVNEAPLPSWIDILAPDSSAKAPEGSYSDGVFFLLADTQVHVEKEAFFCHYAVKILSNSGVQSSSTVKAEWDPSYQRLDFHFIRVHRGTSVQERLDPAAFSVIQREENLESYMYDGSLSAILFLEDVRKGDVIEYAYTVTGRNPVFGGTFADSCPLSFSVPIARLRHRLVHPAVRPLRTRGSEEGLEPVRTARGKEEELVWDRSGVAAVIAEDSLPLWCEPYAYAEQSEYRTWAEVDEWARKLFLPRMEAGLGIKALAAELKAARPGREEAVLAAIRFVQDEVRYLGIEIGAYSHRPSDPEAVLKRRYGDCKDKALLLCALLAELGEEAHPALVSTDSGLRLRNFLPSPYAFDHAVTVLEYGGKRVWIDPTISHQRGSLSALHFPDYGLGLVLAPGETDISPIPAPAPGSISISEDFALSNTPGEKDALTIRSVYSGLEADDMRYRVASESRESLAKDFLDYCSGDYPGLSSAGELKIEDDEEANVLTLTERYVFELGGMVGERGWFDFHASNLASYLVFPDEDIRKRPFDLGPRVKVFQSMRIGPLEKSEPVTKDYAFDCEEFHFLYSNDCEDGYLSLRWELELKAESVAADSLATYRKTAREALAFVDYSIDFSPSGPGTPNLPFALALVFAALLAAAAGVVFLPRLPSPRLPAFLSPSGSLVKAAPALCLAFLISGAAALAVLAVTSPALDLDEWYYLFASIAPAHDRILASCLVAEGIAAAALFGLRVLGAWALIRKRPGYAALVSAQAAAQAAFALADIVFALAAGDFPAFGLALRGALACAAFGEAFLAAPALALSLSASPSGPRLDPLEP